VAIVHRFQQLHPPLVGRCAHFPFLAECVQIGRQRAVSAANQELVSTYWAVGAEILARQEAEGWAARVIDRLSADLRERFPDASGFSPRNLKYMRAFAAAWPDVAIVQRSAAQLPWRQHMVLLDKLDSPDLRLWYGQACRAVTCSSTISRVGSTSVPAARSPTPAPSRRPTPVWPSRLHRADRRGGGETRHHRELRWHVPRQGNSSRGGGTVLLGLDEGRGVIPADGFQASRVRDALVNACANAVEPALRVPIDIEEFEGALILRADIRELDPLEKPCFVKSRGAYQGSFIRSGDGDLQLTHYEVTQLLSNRTQPIHDVELVPDASSADLDVGLVARIRARSPRGLAGLDDAGLPKPSLSELSPGYEARPWPRQTRIWRSSRCVRP
jgi:predicted nuclease of restriction endonuclease-like (RecB) superfamily